MASSPTAPSSVAAVCTHANLSPIYGTERAKAVIKYVLDDFEPFKDNFAESPMRAQIQRGQSQGLMLSMQHKQSNGARVWIGIFFPPAFPTRGPQVALLLSASQFIVAGHDVVAPNGAVRMDKLDCGANPDMLLNILVSLVVMVDSTNPVGERASPTSSMQQQHQQQQQQQSHNASGSGPHQHQQQQSHNASGTSHNVGSGSSSVPLTAAQQSLHDLFVSDYFKLTDKYLSIRKETMAHGDVLSEAVISLTKEEQALRQEIDLLQIAAQEGAALQSAIAAYNAGAGAGGGVSSASNNNVLSSSSSNTPTNGAAGSPTAGGLGGSDRGFVPIENLTALDCIEPANDLHAQALDLLATVNAYEDQLNFLERCLAKRALSTEQYLRYVNNIARDEFQARFLYHRVVDKLQQDKSRSALMRRFGSQGLDQQVISSVLAANSYNLAKTERALSEMVN